MKTCSKCGIEKDLRSGFYFRKDSGKYRNECKTCVILDRRRDRVERADIYRARDKVRNSRPARKKRHTELKRLLRNSSPERKEFERKRSLRKYYKYKHTGIYNTYTAKRRARKLVATPSWLTDTHNEQIKMFYEVAFSYQAHVDHIVPLKGKEVCGLHVPWNLQILDASANSSKSNKLTKESEQLAWTPKL